MRIPQSNLSLRSFGIWLSVVISLGILISPSGWKHLALATIGLGFGYTLFQTSFGFSSAYRRIFLNGDARGILSQIAMLAVATLLFAPFLLWGGSQFQGAVAPLGLSNVLGAFLFGIGMQLGSGCACGTLYALGGGSTLMIITLVFFGLGSFFASLTDSWFSTWPSGSSFSLLERWGGMGILGQLLVLAVIAVGLWLWQCRQLPAEQEHESPDGFDDWLRLDRWSWLSGALILAFLNTLTLWLAGRPWGVTWGFTLWTAQAFHQLGWTPLDPFWMGSGAESLELSWLFDITAVMNLGVVLGATLAAMTQGKLSLRKPPSIRSVGSALGGGILMGYGSWLAYGCNVGAYFSGIASTSLHGWLWITGALLGTAVGVRIRLLLRL